MPPARTRPQTQKPIAATIESFPTPPKRIPIATGDEDDAQTPRQRMAAKPAGITQGQKQALLDNLQLEITERARKLRAQYALQAQGLRTRLEMRVNRIPSALRKRKLQDLLDEQTEKSKPMPPPPMPVAPRPIPSRAEVVERYTMKRKSDRISMDDDKENESVQNQDLANPKKRTKNTTAPAKGPVRTASKKGAPTAGVLSPRSHNSRTLQRSPLKSALSPKTTQFSRTIGSPVKSATTAAVGRAPTRQAKRTDSKQEDRSSDASNMSTGTTIVHKPTTKKAAATRKPAAPKTTAATRKPAVKKETATPATTTVGGRSLRKRT